MEERGNALFSVIKANRLTGRFFFVRLIAIIQLIQIGMEVVESLQIGSYRIIPDTTRYRFTSDSVLLSRFLRAKRGEIVADFCAGSGIVGLHFFAENPGVKQVVLFELQRELAEMSARTVALNGLQGMFTVENTAIQEIPAQYYEAFSLILCNPPYEKGGFASEKRGEYVLLVEGAEEASPLNALSVRDHVKHYMEEGLDKKEALKRAAKDRGVPKSELYRETLDL